MGIVGYYIVNYYWLFYHMPFLDILGYFTEVNIGYFKFLYAILSYIIFTLGYYTILYIILSYYNT